MMLLLLLLLLLLQHVDDSELVLLVPSQYQLDVLSLTHSYYSTYHEGEDLNPDV